MVWSMFTSRLLTIFQGRIAQNEGRLSVRARTNEFKAFTDEEVAEVEGKYREIFQ